MAFVSLRVQRITAYLLVIVCVVLVYQFYSHGQLVRGKRLRRINSVQRDKRTTAKWDLKEELRISKENASKIHEQKSLLLQEINSLKVKLMNSLAVNRRLRYNIQSLRKKAENAKTEITKLTSQNVDLMEVIESINKSKLRHESDQPYLTDDGSNVPHKPYIAENLPFNSFAKTHIYEPDTQPRPKEYMFRGQHKETRTIRSSRRHIFQIEDKILDMINSNQSLAVTREDFMDGVYRYDINGGADYEFYFRYPRKTNTVIPVRVWRELSKPSIQILTSNKKKLDETINLVLPLSGRLERFQNFIELFIDVCIKKDKNVYLTVVLYGEKDFKTVKKILQGLEKDYGFRKYELVMRDKEFSRGRALHDGVIYWKGQDPNVLMFFCDVDIKFSAEFLRRCRTYSEPGKQVYYPMVFSLYNPKNVYADGTIPEPEAQLKIGEYHREGGEGKVKIFFIGLIFAPEYITTTPIHSLQLLVLIRPQHDQF